LQQDYAPPLRAAVALDSQQIIAIDKDLGTRGIASAQ
jgi:hypothetical protein